MIAIRYVAGTDLNLRIHKHTVGQFDTYQDAVDRINESPNPETMEVVER